MSERAIIQYFLVSLLHFAVAFAPLRFVVKFLMRKELDAARELAFDEKLYLRQLSASRRRKARRDPFLHYCLIGWRESRSPSARFDPTFFAACNPGLAGNPLLLLRHQAPDVPQNDVEALGREHSKHHLAGGCILVFHHARGGGSTKCLGLFENHLVRQGHLPLRLRLLTKSDRLVVLQTSDGAEVHDLIDGFTPFLASVRSLRPRRILVSHVVDINPHHVFSIINKLSEELSCPVDILLHDYVAICSQINLVNDEDATCFSIPEIARCRICVASKGSDIGLVDPGQWRQDFASFVDKADRVFALSTDMVKRLQPHFAKPIIVWRPENDAVVPARIPKLAKSESLRIVVIGALNIAKGSEVISGLGAAIKKHGASISIEVFGESPQHAALRKAGVIVHGPYKDNEILSLLARRNPHLAFLPAIWPETWSFVLTRLVVYGLPVYAFDHGAQAERLRAIGQADTILPSRLISNSEELLEAFLDVRRRLIRLSSSVTS